VGFARDARRSSRRSRATCSRPPSWWARSSAGGYPRGSTRVRSPPATTGTPAPLAIGATIAAVSPSTAASLVGLRRGTTDVPDSAATRRPPSAPRANAAPAGRQAAAQGARRRVLPDRRPTQPPRSLRRQPADQDTLSTTIDEYTRSISALHLLGVRTVLDALRDLQRLMREVGDSMTSRPARGDSLVDAFVGLSRAEGRRRFTATIASGRVS
jgi:hypothetical protein